MASSKIPSSALTLKQFLLRTQVLTLYRDFLRSLRHVPDPTYRKELTKWVRDDFKKNQSQQDEAIIRHQLQQGSAQLKQLQKMIHIAS